MRWPPRLSALLLACALAGAAETGDDTIAAWMQAPASAEPTVVDALLADWSADPTIDQRLLKNLTDAVNASREPDLLFAHLERALALCAILLERPTIDAQRFIDGLGGILVQSRNIGQVRFFDPRIPAERIGDQIRPGYERQIALLGRWCDLVMATGSCLTRSRAFPILVILVDHHGHQADLTAIALAVVNDLAAKRQERLETRRTIPLVQYGQPTRDVVVQLLQAELAGQLNLDDHLPGWRTSDDEQLQQLCLRIDLMRRITDPQGTAADRTLAWEQHIDQLARSWRLESGFDLLHSIASRPDDSEAFVIMRRGLIDSELASYDFSSLVAWCLDQQPAGVKTLIDPSVLSAMQENGSHAANVLLGVCSRTKRPGPLTTALAPVIEDQPSLANNLFNTWRNMVYDRRRDDELIDSWTDAPWSADAAHWSPAPTGSVQQGSLLGGILAAMDDQGQRWMNRLPAGDTFGQRLTRALLALTNEPASATTTIAELLTAHAEAIETWDEPRHLALAHLLQRRGDPEQLLAALPPAERTRYATRFAAVARARSAAIARFLAADKTGDLVEHPHLLRDHVQRVIGNALATPDTAPQLKAIINHYCHLVGDRSDRVERELPWLVGQAIPDQVHPAAIAAIDACFTGDDAISLVINGSLTWGLSNPLRGQRDAAISTADDPAAAMDAFIDRWCDGTPTDPPPLLLYAAGKRLVDGKQGEAFRAALAASTRQHPLIDCWRSAVDERDRDWSATPDHWLARLVQDERYDRRIRCQLPTLLERRHHPSGTLRAVGLPLLGQALAAGWRPQDNEVVALLDAYFHNAESNDDAAEQRAANAAFLDSLVAMPVEDVRRLLPQNPNNEAIALTLLAAAPDSGGPHGSELIERLDHLLARQTATIRALLLRDQPAAAAAFLQRHWAACRRDQRLADDRPVDESQVATFLAACAEHGDDLALLARVLWGRETDIGLAAWNDLADACQAHDWHDATMQSKALAIFATALLPHAGACAAVIERVPEPDPGRWQQNSFHANQLLQADLHLARALLPLYQGDERGIRRLLQADQPSAVATDTRATFRRRCQGLILDPQAVAAADPATRAACLAATTRLLSWLAGPERDQLPLLAQAIVCDSLAPTPTLPAWFDALGDDQQSGLRCSRDQLSQAAIDLLHGLPPSSWPDQIVSILSHPLILRLQPQGIDLLAALRQRDMVSEAMLAELMPRLAAALPQAAEIWAELARMQTAAGDHQEALATWRHARMARGDDRLPNHWLIPWAKSLAAVGRDDDAILLLDSVPPSRVPAADQDWALPLIEASRQRQEQADQAVLDQF